MRRLFVFTSLLVVVFPAYAADAFLCSDTFQGGTAGFQNGFIGNEEAAERVDPPQSALPMTITDAWLFFGQNDDLNATTETIKIYDADGTDFAGSPGTVLGSTPAPLVDSTDSIQQVTFNTPVTVNGPFWIALHFDQGSSPEPGPATDGASGNSAKAAILASDVGFYVHASDLGVHGDWVLRVEGNAAAAQNDGACRIGGGGGEGEGEGASSGEGEGSSSGEGEGEGASSGEGEGASSGEGEGEGQASGLVITSVNPSSAFHGDDTKVTLTGAGFVAATTAVRVGNATCSDVQVENAGALLCTVPGSLAVGTYDVIAQNGADLFVFPSGFQVNPVDAQPTQPGGCTCASSSTTGALSALAALLLSFRLRPASSQGSSRRPAPRR